MDGTSVLVCSARRRFVAVPLPYVMETMRPLPVERLAGAPPFVRGLSVIRGRATPVLDAASLVGEAASDDVRRYVTLRAESRVFALAVDDVRGVESLLPDALEALPPFMGPESRAIFAGVGRLDTALIVVLEAMRLVPEATWALVDARGNA